MIPQNNELDEILVELLGKPLSKDLTYVPMQGDPYGIQQLSDTTRTMTPKIEPSYESYETVKRQFRRLPAAKAKLEALIRAREKEELENIAKAGYDDMHKTYDFDLIAETLLNRIEELKGKESK